MTVRQGQSGRRCGLSRGLGYHPTGGSVIAPQQGLRLARQPLRGGLAALLGRAGDRDHRQGDVSRAVYTPSRRAQVAEHLVQAEERDDGVGGGHLVATAHLGADGLLDQMATQGALRGVLQEGLGDPVAKARLVGRQGRLGHVLLLGQAAWGGVQIGAGLSAVTSQRARRRRSRAWEAAGPRRTRSALAKSRIMAWP